MLNRLKVGVFGAFLVMGILPSFLLSAGQAPDGAALAKLLRIPVDPPAVEVTVRGTEQAKGLLVQDITWLGEDDQHPTAFVIRPERSDSERLPAVICLHGSTGSRESMATEFFGVGDWTRFGAKEPHKRLLGWARELSRRGFLTLALTQRGLDSRLPNTEIQTKDLLVHGRTMMGAEVQEIRQAITYLRSRPDVDPDRIGLAGLSFGGITGFYTWVVDPRAKAMASICGGVGSVESVLREGSPSYHGIYWWVPDMLTVGDQGAFAASAAPRPLMLWAPLNDIGMPKEGVAKFLDEVRPAYDRTGAASNLTVIRLPGEHTFSLEAFESMVQFLNRHLGAK